MEIRRLNNSKVKLEFPTVIILEEAYAQLQSFMHTEYAKTKEFVFMGEVIRTNPKKFTITKLFLVPQENCSAVHCETDEVRLAKLYASMPIDEIRRIRLHGHSHVNMACNPSPDDVNNTKKFVESVSDFALQIIVNLRNEYTLNLFDYKTKLEYYGLKLKLLVGNNYLLTLPLKTEFLIPSNVSFKGYKSVIDSKNNLTLVISKNGDLVLETKYLKIHSLGRDLNNTVNVLDETAITNAEAKLKYLVKEPIYNYSIPTGKQYGYTPQAKQQEKQTDKDATGLYDYYKKFDKKSNTKKKEDVEEDYINEYGYNPRDYYN